VGVLGWIAVCALAVVVIAWLIVSFVRPGTGRTLAAWAATIGMYVALLCLFVHLVSRARAEDSTAGLVGFGFLASLFAIGLVVAVARTVLALRAGPSKDASATH
jgi:hypothetical protein